MREVLNLLECLKMQGEKSVDLNTVLAAANADARDYQLICNNCKCPVCGNTKKDARRISRDRERTFKNNNRKAGTFMQFSCNDDTFSSEEYEL